MAIIEYSRNVLGHEDANSTEMNENTSHPVVNLMEEQKTITDKGGTMRLGAWKCDIKQDSLAQKIYGKETFRSVTVTVMSTIVTMLLNYKMQD